MWFAQSYETTTVVVSSNDSSSWAAFGLLWLLSLAVWVIMIVALWKVFEKAGEAGWKAIIPFYSSYIMFKIAGRNGWWFLALFVPFVNIFVLLMLGIDMAKHFGKSTAFGVVALWLFSAIGYLILGYSDAEYVGQKHE